VKGFVHVYTGNGKGKTTAAPGLAMRAAGAGKRVFIGQFVKGRPYSEHPSLEKLGIRHEQYGLDCFIVNEPAPKGRKAARDGFRLISEVIMSGTYDLVVLDEIHIALHYKLIGEKELIQLIHSRPSHVELVLTGRKAPASVMEAADLVTEMLERKHYYTRGIEAREGIEF
jgi:cob(I)alamin adenosyltransferase